MSGNNINNETNRKRSLEKPTNADYANKSKRTDPNEVEIRIYFENKLTDLSQLTRDKLEEITIRTMCKLVDQHINTDKLVHKLNEIKQKLASLQSKYNDLKSQIAQISGSENNGLRTLDTRQNPNTIQIRRTVHVERDAQVTPPVIFIDLTDEDESTSLNEALPLTSGSEPEDKSKEDTAIGSEAIEKEPSPPKESQKSIE